MTPDSSLAPFAAWAGPHQAKIVFVGEAWGESESQLRQPFVGESGKEFWRMLGESLPSPSEAHARASALHRYGLAWVRERGQWLDEAHVGFTNVLALRPPGNKLEELCGTKKEVGGDSYGWPALAKGKYLRPEYLPEVARLQEELGTAKPNLVVALGNTACWALLRATNVGTIRGTVANGTGSFGGVKVLPTYHPAGVLRQWSWRTIVVADLIKAWREASSPEITRPRRSVLVNPTLEECETWVNETLNGKGVGMLSVDIETGGGQIKCVGFGRSRDEALVIPFVDLAKSKGSYWADTQSEALAWKCVERLLDSPLPKLFQNGLYDLQYLLRMGFAVQNCAEDTMLLHHSLYPELQKGLGFLGSIYTSEPAWKLMRRQQPDNSAKRDE